MAIDKPPTDAYHLNIWSETKKKNDAWLLDPTLSDESDMWRATRSFHQSSAGSCPVFFFNNLKENASINLHRRIKKHGILACISSVSSICKNWAPLFDFGSKTLWTTVKKLNESRGGYTWCWCCQADVSLSLCPEHRVVFFVSPSVCMTVWLYIFLSFLFLHFFLVNICNWVS